MINNNKTSVLVVHDSMMMCCHYCDILMQGGYEVEVAAHASEGMRKALIQTFDVFLICVHIPECANYHFIKNMRADRVFCNTLTIMISHGAKTSDMLAALDAGVDIYLHKPITAEEMNAHMCIHAKQEIHTSFHDMAHQTTAHQREYVSRRFGGYPWGMNGNTDVSVLDDRALHAAVMVEVRQCLLHCGHIQSLHAQQASEDLCNRVYRILHILRSVCTVIDMPSVRLNSWFSLVKHRFEPDSIAALIRTVELLKEDIKHHLLMMQTPQCEAFHDTAYVADASLTEVSA